MDKAIKEYYLIKNFPKDYPWYKKLAANIIFFIAGRIIHPRKNLLSYNDLVNTNKSIKRGDIILAGNLRTVFGKMIRDPITHSAIYIGKRRIIHARSAKGTRIDSLHFLLTYYDTLVLLRIPKKIGKRKRIIKEAIFYAKKQLGKPYDFDFSKDEGKFFCSELVNNSFRKAGYDTGVKILKRPKKLRSRLSNKIMTFNKAYHPEMFIKGKFDIIFMSHNLKFKNNKLALIKD